MNKIDTESLKRDHPVEEIVERYGIELHLSGHALIGRCPFHDDGGRPNLYVYRDTQRWYCYRCSLGGDVISFVERIEGVGFRDAVTYLTGDWGMPRRATRPIRRTKRRPRNGTPWGPDERACLAAAVELYHNTLLTEPAARAYLHGRGLDGSIIERCQLGYVAGDELAAYLHWRRLPLGPAMRIGLLTRDGREFLAGRVLVPEIRGGQPIWLVGRTIEPDDGRPRYLGLPGRKPLFGWEMAKETREVFLVEGVFDWLTLLSWGYPVLALVGTHVRSEALAMLARFQRVVLLLDNDGAGRRAAELVAGALGERALVVSLPGVKDVAELATRPDGLTIFLQAARGTNHLAAA